MWADHYASVTLVLTTRTPEWHHSCLPIFLSRDNTGHNSLTRCGWTTAIVGPRRVGLTDVRQDVMGVCLSVWVPACLYDCLSVCMSACVSVWLPVCLSVWLPVCHAWRRDLSQASKQFISNKWSRQQGSRVTGQQQDKAGRWWRVKIVLLRNCSVCLKGCVMTFFVCRWDIVLINNVCFMGW